MLFERQTFLVAGLSRSGVSAAEYLISRGACVYAYDDVEDESVTAAAVKLSEIGCHIVSKDELEEKSERCDVLVLSPGIPVDHPLPVMFRKAGKRIIGETELGALAVRCPVVAVTGTNGKTTTVSMLEGIFRTAGKHAVACANIGKPFTSCVGELGENGVAVAEISSFQLETLYSLRPHVAIVLNVTEDHLNRHYNMENYTYLKAKILHNSAESEYAVLNYDDPIVRSFAEKTRAKVVWFSLNEKVAGGYIADGGFYFLGERILSESDLPIDGDHNRANALAAICAAKLFGVGNAAIIAALKSFRGVKHRLQKVGELGGVTFIDDSKATNVDSAIKAIESVRGESVLLVGGKDKGYSYEQLFEAVKKSGVVHAVIYGENAFRVLNSALKQGFTAVTLCRPFDMAVRVAYLTAKRGQSVLLSPASASFDAFKNYEERGERFTEMISVLAEEGKREKLTVIAGGDGENGEAE
jgi:UDP-N-acetylmuramoylalanine--D-glutamate ligase